jgi:hypothetical protein
MAWQPLSQITVGYDWVFSDEIDKSNTRLKISNSIEIPNYKPLGILCLYNPYKDEYYGYKRIYANTSEDVIIDLKVPEDWLFFKVGIRINRRYAYQVNWIVNLARYVVSEPTPLPPGQMVYTISYIYGNPDVEIIKPTLYPYSFNVTNFTDGWVNLRWGKLIDNNTKIYKLIPNETLSIDISEMETDALPKLGLYGDFSLMKYPFKIPWTRANLNNDGQIQVVLDGYIPSNILP